jgi:hypothetical protein
VGVFEHLVEGPVDPGKWVSLNACLVDNFRKCFGEHRIFWREETKGKGIQSIDSHPTGTQATDEAENRCTAS